MRAQRWGRVEHIGGLIAGALPARVQRHMAGWLAVEVWPRVVGREAARRSAAVAFRDGRLTVEVVNSVWLHRLISSNHHYLQRLNQEIDGVVVSEIIYRVNPGLSQASEDGQPGPERASVSTSDPSKKNAVQDGATRKADVEDESVQQRRETRGLGDEEPAGG